MCRWLHESPLWWKTSNKYKTKQAISWYLHTLKYVHTFDLKLLSERNDCGLQSVWHPKSYTHASNNAAESGILQNHEGFLSHCLCEQGKCQENSLINMTCFSSFTSTLFNPEVDSQAVAQTELQEISDRV